MAPASAASARICSEQNNRPPPGVLMTMRNRRFSPLSVDQNSFGLQWTLNPGRLGPRGAATRVLPDDAQHKPLEKMQPAWRDRIANLKVPMSGQQKKERGLILRACLAGGQASEHGIETGCQAAYSTTAAMDSSCSTRDCCEG